MIESLYILIICAISCGLIGVFVLLRGLSMVTDAISHSVLLGIVLAFFMVHSIDSPALLLGASLFGVLTVLCIELLAKTGLVKKQDAVGIVFPIFFATAVILITKYARNIHIDTEIVLMGDVILAPLNRMTIFGISTPKFLFANIVMLLINLIFIGVFYKELKASTFDPEFAIIAGFSSGALFYALMTLVSMTAVVAFNAVGSILVISFFITPGLSAYLLTKRLSHMLVLTALLGTISSIIGFYSSIAYNVSMAGMSALVSMLIFLLITLIHQNGIITQFLMKRRRRREQLQDLLIIHIGNHWHSASEQEELGIHSILKHLNWKKELFDKQAKILKNKGLIVFNHQKEIVELTEIGTLHYRDRCNEYGIRINN